MASYALPVFDGVTDRKVALNSNNRVVIDGNEIVNQPDQPPPVGEFPVDAYTIPFLLTTPTAYDELHDTVLTRLSNTITSRHDNFP